jgi:hypothetical protein
MQAWKIVSQILRWYRLICLKLIRGEWLVVILNFINHNLVLLLNVSVVKHRILNNYHTLSIDLRYQSLLSITFDFT